MSLSCSLIVRNARLRDGTVVDIGVEDEQIRRVEPSLEVEAPEEIDAGGGFTSPPLIEPHCHLDTALTEGDAGHNQSGGLLEGIEIWSRRKQDLTVRDVKQRATEAIKWYASHGALYIRSHVDVCDPELTGLRALLEVQEECRDLVDLQLVAFPQEGIASYENGKHLVEEALRLGCDLVGAIPHYEITREMGVESLQTVFDLARRYARPIDVHCDETDDDQSRFLETLTALTLEHGMEGLVTGSHTTAMHSYSDAYMAKLYGWLRKARMNLVANPLTNILLQGVFDGYPRRRGMLRVKELMERGINVCFGEDCVMDPWYPLGTGNLLQAAFMGLHVGQMSGYEEIPRIWDAITTHAATTLDVEDRYGIEPGKQADLVIYDQPSLRDVLRILPPARWCVKRGRVISTTSPPRTTLHRGDQTESLTYRREFD